MDINNSRVHSGIPGLFSDRGTTAAIPWAYRRDIWALGSSITKMDEHCANPNAHGGLPNTFGMFDPVWARTL